MSHLQHRAQFLLCPRLGIQFCILVRLFEFSLESSDLHHFQQGLSTSIQEDSVQVKDKDSEQNYQHYKNYSDQWLDWVVKPDWLVKWKATILQKYLLQNNNI